MIELETALHIATKQNKQEIISLYILKMIEDVQGKTPIVNMFDANFKTPLSYACMSGNLDATKHLLRLGADPNIHKAHSIPLIEAIKSCNIDLVTFLLNSGANIHASDAGDNFPLHHAVLVQKHHIVNLLIERMANPNCLNSRKQTPLHLSIEVTKNQRNRSLKIERILVKNGANFNALDYFGKQ